MVDHGEFYGADILDKVDGFAFLDLQLAFDRGKTDEEFAEHHQADACMQEDDTGPLFEDE